VFVKGRLAEVALAGDTQDVVAVERAPEGGEGVAPAEVDAADGPAHGDAGGVPDAGVELGVDEALQGGEQAAVLLIDPGAAQAGLLGLDEGRGDARDLVVGDARP
jgi:hypothetical protein